MAISHTVKFDFNQKYFSSHLCDYTVSTLTYDKIRVFILGKEYSDPTPPLMIPLSSLDFPAYNQDLPITVEDPQNFATIHFTFNENLVDPNEYTKLIFGEIRVFIVGNNISVPKLKPKTSTQVVPVKPISKPSTWEKIKSFFKHYSPSLIMTHL